MNEDSFSLADSTTTAEARSSLAREFNSRASRRKSNPRVNTTVFRRFLRFVQIVALVVAFLPLARWTRDYLTASEILFSPDDATAVESLPGGLSYSVQTVDEEGRATIFAHAPSRLEWALHIRPGKHKFEVDLAVSPTAWEKERFDGVTFRGFIVRGTGERKLFSVRLDPRKNPEQRKWLPVNAFVESDGDSVIFALETLPGGNTYHDWAYWGEPRIYESTRPPSLVVVLGAGVVYCICAWIRRRGKKESHSDRTSVFQGLLLILFGLVVSAGLVEGFFQLFPKLFPYSAYKYLPNNGLCYFRDSNQRDVYDDEIGYLRRPYVRWSWQRKNDLVGLNRVPPIYVSSDLPVIEFRTDGDGFRNSQDFEHADVIALGDSFTEAPQVQAEEAWPSVVSAITGLTVRNLGMSGYAPQQAMFALERFGLPLSPELVLFPVFEGNDLIDAEQYKVYRESHLPWPVFWAKCNSVTAARSSVWLRVHYSFLRATLFHLGDLIGPVLWGRRPWAGPARYTLFNPVRGEIAGVPIRMAFYDHYLHTSSLSKEYWSQRGGWGLTCDTILRVKELCDEANARLVIVIFPTKGGVYLPLLQGAYDPDKFDRYIIEMMGESPAEGHTWQGDFLSNHRDLSTIVQEFCVAHAIDCLDLWPAFHAAASQGELVYFPFDTHWNAQGHRLAAKAMVHQLQERGYLNADTEEME